MNFTALDPLPLATFPWYEQKLQGWYYFQEEECGTSLSLSDAEELLQEQKQHLHQLLSLALLDPTEENIRLFAREQARWIHRSALFADRWGKFADGEEDAHFLLFCFRGKDPRSSAAAQAAQEFATAHGWPIKALSLDGYGTEPFDSYEIDRGLSQHLEIDQVPCLYLIHPQTNQSLRVQ